MNDLYICTGRTEARPPLVKDLPPGTVFTLGSIVGIKLKNDDGGISLSRRGDPWTPYYHIGDKHVTACRDDTRPSEVIGLLRGLDPMEVGCS